MKRLLLVLSLLLAPVAMAQPYALLVEEGDLVFQKSKSAQSEAIALATHSDYTHMGLVIFEGGRLVVYEAVQPVKKTPLDEWIGRGVGGKVVVRRLRNAKEALTVEGRKELRRVLRSFLGRPYDLQFRWDDDRIYCSELVYKAFERALDIRIGRQQHVSDLALASPTVQKKLRERFGKDLSGFLLDEIVVTPQAMFEDEKLVTVYRN